MNKKRGYYTIVTYISLFLLLFSTLISAQFIPEQFEDDEENPFQDATSAEKETLFTNDPSLAQQYPEEWKKFIDEKFQINYEGSTAGIQYNNGILTTQDGTSINLNTLHGKGYTINAQAGRVSLTDSDGESTEIINGENVHLDGETLVIDRVDTLSTSSMVISGGVNVRIIGDEITAEHVDSLIQLGSVGSNIDNLISNTDTFYVERADSVLSGCVRIDNIEDSTINSNEDIIQMSTGNDVSLDIVDCSSNNVKFLSNNGSIAVTKTIPADYTIESGILEYNSSTFNEKIISNNSVTATLDQMYGFSCMTLSPPGTYFYNDENILKDFAAHVPEEGIVYKLCIRKDAIQHFADYDGITDFVMKRINLNSVINYMRYAFDDNGILLDLFMKDVYQGIQQGNNATMILDDDFIYVNDLFIENEDPTPGMLSYINNGHYAVYEYNFGNEIRRYGRFNEEYLPKVIRQYNSYFGSEQPPVYFTEGIMNQEGFNNNGEKISVKAVCKSCPQKQEFEQNMMERRET